MAGQTKVKPSPIYVPSRETTASVISTLGDSHFQLPIRRSQTHPKEHDEGLNSTQHEALEGLDSSPGVINQSLSFNAGSQADMITEEAQGQHHAATNTGFVPVAQDFKEFYDAIAAGNIGIVRAKLDIGMSLWHKSEDGITPLVMAITEHQLDMVTFLLENGASVHQKARFLAPIAHAARTDGNVSQIIQSLLDFGADLNALSGSERFNALHWAARYGKVDAVNFLVSKGINLELRCGRGFTALFMAIVNGHVTVAKVLLAKGAALDGSSYLDIAFTTAARSGHANTVKFLLEEKVEVNQCDDEGYHALTVVSRMGRLGIVELLIERRANVNATSNNSESITPLGAAAMEGQVEVVKLLLEHGADLQHINGWGQTVLELAMMRGHRETIDVLLRAIDGDYFGNTLALDFALSDNHISTVSLMATASHVFSESSLQNSMKREPAWIEWVLETGGPLLKPRAMATIMECALQEGKLDIVEELIVLGYDPNKHFTSGHTPLSTAIYYRNVELIRLLLDVGADPTISTRVLDNNLTPLHQALVLLEPDLEKDTTIVDALLESKRCKLMQGHNHDETAFSYILSQVDKWDHGVAEILTFRMLESTEHLQDDIAKDGSTLMHVAVYHNRKDLVDILLQKGLNINAVDKTMKTPFLLGCRQDIHMTKFLYSKGADIFAKQSACLNALHVAASHGDIKTTGFLLSMNLDIHARTIADQTPLMLAIHRGIEQAALRLLYHDPSTRSAKTMQDRTILHLTANRRMEKLVTKLLSYPDMDVNAQDKHGWTPLALACLRDSASMHSITSLLDAGADIEIPNGGDDRPLHIALMGKSDSCAQLLIQRGALLTPLGSQRRTPLHLAAEYHNPLAARDMLEKGASLDARDSSDWTPLYMYDDPEMMQLFVDHGADVNHVDAQGWTPVHQAVECGSVGNFEVLVRAGARLEEDVLEMIEGLEEDHLREDLLDVVVVYNHGLAKRYGRRVVES